MSKTNDIKLLLDIKNIEIDENAVGLKVFKRKMTTFITTDLTFTPLACKCCGIENKNYTIFKKGRKRSRINLSIA